MKTISKFLGLTLILGGVGYAPVARSAPADNKIAPMHAGYAPMPLSAPEVGVTDVRTTTVQVPLNKSRMLHLKTGGTAIKMGNPSIAKLDSLSPNQILIQGISLGTTNIVVSSGQRVDQVINVEVTHDLDTLKARLHELLPGEMIEARSSQNNIVLSGQVSGLDKIQSALDIATSFLPNVRSGGNPGGQGGGNYQTPDMSGSGANTGGNGSNTNQGNNPQNNLGPRVINMLSVSGAHQVMLEVKVAEIDRSLARGLNIQFNAIKPGDMSFGALSGGGTFLPSFGANTLTKGLNAPLSSILIPDAHSINAAGLFLSAVSGDFIFNLTVDAAKDQNLAKILAEPTLTTMSGQEAKFISGGEFPIPVPQNTSVGAGTITIEFKQFGITLRCIPVVLDSGRINLNMNVGVSELSDDAAVVTQVPGSDLKFTIPSLTKREASSTLELADGQTMSIAGLISDTLRENVNKFPGLGDLPVLGALFRNEKFLNQQTELVIFVTPKLAKPVLAKNISLPTDNFVAPDDVDFYVFGKMEARDAEKQLKSREMGAVDASQGGLDGQFGHELSEERK